MASYNKVLLIGNLTRDPEVRYLPTGSAVCEFGLAMNRRYTTGGGQEKEETCFIDIVVWAKQAENCGRFLKKGASTLVEGRLQMDQWQDRETGQNRSRLRVVAERVQFLSGRSDGPGGSQDFSAESSNNYSNQNYSGQQQAYTPNNQQVGYQQPSPSPMPSMPQPQAPATQAVPQPVQPGMGATDPYNQGGAPSIPEQAFEVEPEDDIPF